ncbi:MAG TPA: helix-turn-helix domain-containing protein [Candidatus Faecimorpha stercoravium]|nr:helix-turn-helix domain-containing protein [Candidatus Faecimorpha stercoravium]
MVDWKKITRQHKVHTDLRRGWLISYLVIFCVPLAAYLLISSVTLGIIRNQTYDLNEQALHVISVAVDHQVQSVEEMATEISANTILNEILSMEQETAQHEWRLYELQNELISMVSRNSMIEQIYIYFYDGNYLLSDTTKAKPAYFYENQCSGLVMNEKEWENILRTPHLKEYQIWENGSSRPIPMLLLSLPLFDGAPKATICIQLAPQKFWQVVESNEDMAMAIYDGQERQLYLESYETEASPVVLQSSATGWRYEGYIEDAVLEAQEGYVQVMNVWGVFLVLLVGGAAIWIFIRRNYNPIRSIIARFEQISDRKEKEVGEYSFIENALNQLILRVQENREEIQEQLTLMDQAYMICFLMGQCPKGISREEQLRVWGFEESTMFSVLILEFGQPITVQHAAEILAIGTDEICLYFGRGVELNGRIVFMIDANSEDEESRRQVQDRLLEQNAEARLAWSSPYPGGSQISYAYEEAQYILHGAEEGQIGILTLQQMQQRENRWIQIPNELEKGLAQAVKNKNTDALDSTVEQLWSAYVEERTSSLVDAKTAAMAIYNLVYGICQIHPGAYSRQEMLAFRNIQVRPQSYEEVKKALQAELRRIAAKEEGRSASRDEQLVKRMQEYIDQHYADVLLSVDSLCQVFHRAPSGVNKAFKDVTGHGPLHYINYRRIQEAKRIFIESGGMLSASEVLKQVGYTNLNTFTRAFKKNEGITPGQFKDAIWQANQGVVQKS